MPDGLESYKLRRELQDLLFGSGKYIDGGGSGYNLQNNTADFDLQIKDSGLRFNIVIQKLEDNENSS